MSDANENLRLPETEHTPLVGGSQIRLDLLDSPARKWRWVKTGKENEAKIFNFLS